MSPDLSVVILCYRSGKEAYPFVEKTIKLLERTVPSYELILVGNYLEGVEDETPETVRDIAAKFKNVKAVTLPKKGMMGWDVRMGLERAEGNYLCFIDGDNQMPAEDIMRIYDLIKSQRLDLVKTYRKRRFDSLSRVFISFVYNVIFKVLFPYAKVKDINSKPKIFTRDAYLKMCLSSDDWFIDAEIIIKASRLGLKIAEVPTEFHKCEYRKSFVKPTAILEFIKNLIRAKIAK